MLGETSSNVEVCHLVLHLAVSLRLTSACLARAGQLLEATLTVVHSGVLAKDEVGAAEFVHGFFALVVRVELTI